MYSHIHWKNTQCCSETLCFSDAQIKQILYSCAGAGPFVAVVLFCVVFCALKNSVSPDYKLPQIITFAESSPFLPDFLNNQY